MNKDKIIELGLKKIKGEIDLKWSEIGKMFGLDGETVRALVKNYRYRNGMVSGIYEDGKKRILCVGDFHYPFNLPIGEFAKYRDRIDYLIINGDEQDCQSISKYIKKYRYPFVEEMIGTRQMLIDLINLIKPKHVIFNKGNHNIRLINYFSEKLHDDLLKLMPETNLDFIVEIGFWEYNHEKRTKTFYSPLKQVFADSGIDIHYTHEWFCQVGKTIFAHPSAYRSGILKTSEQAYKYFMQEGFNDIDCLVLSHTHSFGFTKYGNVFLYEHGCWCKTMDYVDAKLINPQTPGYIYLVQNADGSIDFNHTKLILGNDCDVGSRKKRVRIM